MLTYKEYDKIFSTCPIPCIYGKVIKDDKGDYVDFNIDTANDSMLNLLGVYNEDIDGKSIKYVIPDLIEKVLTLEEYIDEYITVLDGWYKVEIVKLNEESFIIWFIENKEIKHIRLREALEDSIPDYIFFKDKYSRIVDCNKSYADKLVEREKKDIIGKSDYELEVVDKDARDYRNRDLEVMESRETKTYYEDVTLNDGSLRHLETIKTPLVNDSGEVTGLVGIARDITDRKIAEDAVEKTRLESFANLSHELRTPLNLIFSSVQVLDKGYDIVNKKTNKKDDKYLKIIRQNGYRLLKLVDNIIDSSKVSYGALDFEPKDYDIVNFIESICQSVSDFARQNSMNIVFDTDIEEKIIGFDLYKMERIMLNLLSNALKFNKKEGTIEVFIKEKGNDIEIIVKDEGIGIPKKEINSVFDRFKQVQNKESNTKVGSGIGLSLVKSLVALHNGRINVKSELGKGTEFIMSIPNITYNQNCDSIDKENLKDKFVQKIEVEFSDIYI